MNTKLKGHSGENNIDKIYYYTTVKWLFLKCLEWILKTLLTGKYLNL